MEDLLDQSDIDALLNAVEDGEVDESPDEKQIFSRYRRDLEGVEIRDYDFKRPERISKDQMRALQTLHETFARNFGASLSGFLRTIVEVRVAHAEQMTYSEFIAGLPNPTSFNLIDSEQLSGQLCLELSPLIIYPIIDRLLGGNNHDLFIPQRAMTLIEERLIAQVLTRAIATLTEAWEGVKPVSFSLGEMESNPHIVQIVPPNEVVVVIGFEIKMSSRAGSMALCIPFNAIEPLISDLSAQNWFLAGRDHTDAHWAHQITDELSDARVEVAGVLAETIITMDELRSLEVGDIITTAKASNQPVLITVGGISKHVGNIGDCRGKRAIQVLRPVNASDRM